MNLAEMCRAHLPFWLNVSLYILAEAAIIATDIAEVSQSATWNKTPWRRFCTLILFALQVIGTAIALDLLFKIPLVAGCAISIIEVLIILLFYNEHGSMRRLRAFEVFIAALVLGVVVCFCVQLSLIENVSVGEVFRGYMPSSGVVQGEGIYLSAGIIGATVMVHSLYRKYPTKSLCPAQKVWLLMCEQLEVDFPDPGLWLLTTASIPVQPPPIDLVRETLPKFNTSLPWPPSKLASTIPSSNSSCLYACLPSSSTAPF